MELQEHQQLHRGVVDGIAHLEDPYYHEQRHRLLFFGRSAPVNRRSVQHLVHFLDDSDSHEVTELVLFSVGLSHPSDGSLDVLRDFFARSDTTLTKVTLWNCNFGSQDDASLLLSAFQTNRTVLHLTLIGISRLHGAALGTSLFHLMQRIPQLQRLDCSGALGVEGVRAMQPALQVNRTLKELRLMTCRLDNEGSHLIADALVGNTTIEILDMCGNRFTYNGLADITRLLEATQLKTIILWQNRGLFNDEDATQHFVTTLQNKSSSVQELPGIDENDFPEGSRAATYASINNSLTRNQQLNRVNLLLAPPSPPQPPQQQRNAGAMMLKIWHKAITKFAMVPNNAGASAIFKLFQARPALLEKRLKRPAAAAVSLERKRRRF